MTETWIPSINDDVKCIDASYSGCEEKLTVGQQGRVTNIYRDVDTGLDVLVISFNAHKANNPDPPSKQVFKEYFCTKRQPYLYFAPVRPWK